jgi:hypothetical protein
MLTARSVRDYALPIITGLLILTSGLAPWTLLAKVNARLRPDLPWAALATLGYLAILLLWLGGWGPPRRTAGERRRRLRLWPPAQPQETASRAEPSSCCSGCCTWHGSR